MAAYNSDHHCKLPEDLIIEIFLRSSVESLLRAKCVCKRWYTLIKNPSFTQKHLDFQRLSKKEGRLLLTSVKASVRDCGSDYTYSLFNDETLADTSYRCLLNLEDQYSLLHLEGPINGIYCLFNEVDRIVMWNPALKQMRLLPVPQFSVPITRYSNVIGFGLDPLSEEDFKVVLLCKEYNKDSLLCGISGIFAMVYTLSTNTWRLVEDYEDDSREEIPEQCSLSSTYLNGFYYWWLSFESWKILVFDMGKDAFRLISGPSTCTNETDIFDGHLTLFHDHVALWIEKTNHCEIDVWVMVEDDFWTKLFSVKDVARFVLPAGFWTNDELLLVTDDHDQLIIHDRAQMVLYNTGTHEIKKIGPKSFARLLKASAYYESLVSVVGSVEYDNTDLSDFLRPFNTTDTSSSSSSSSN